VATYQFEKDLGNLRVRLESAYKVLSLIQKARAFNLIRDTKQQAREYEQEIEQLKEQIDNLRTLNDKLTIENKRLHNLVGRTNRQGDTEIGDVGH
jgi:uncharacterized protein YlxW (UPF0749 family)